MSWTDWFFRVAYSIYDLVFIEDAERGEAPPLPTFRRGVDCILSLLGLAAPSSQTDTRAVVEGVPYLSPRSRRRNFTRGSPISPSFEGLIPRVLTVPGAVNPATPPFPTWLGSEDFRGFPIVLRCLAVPRTTSDWPRGATVSPVLSDGQVAFPTQQNDDVRRSFKLTLSECCSPRASARPPTASRQKFDSPSRLSPEARLYLKPARVDSTFLADQHPCDLSTVGAER